MPDEGVYVLDACAVVAFRQREEGADKVANLLEGTNNRCLLHAINACEVFYDVYRRDGEEDAGAVGELLEKSGISIVQDLSVGLWTEAGKLKATWRRVSLADCFALALAVRAGATLVTSDHHELDDLAQAGVCPSSFIR